jgi:hypothetical protein
MKKTLLTLVIALAVLSADAQIEKLAGPRVGITMVTPGLLANILKKDASFFSDENREEWTGSIGKYGAVMSQYGWQWESRFSDEGQVTGIVEWIALVGGMEKGMFLPSVSSMVGVRTASGVEFAVGPNLSLGGIAMVIGAGYNFKFGKLNVPVNIAYVPSMNKTYDHEEERVEYGWVQGYDDEDGNWIDGYEDTNDVIREYQPAYSATHPTGARISVMVGFNLSK